MQTIALARPSSLRPAGSAEPGASFFQWNGTTPARVRFLAPGEVARSEFGFASGLAQLPAALSRRREEQLDGAREYRFRSFELLPGSRILLRNGAPVECGSRAFDLLHALLQKRGRLVEKQDLVAHVWPTTIVEESNLRFQMATLRRTLGRDRDLIKTIPGRGYLFALERPADGAPGARQV
jgi:DNA-binding response OmpR family regulator